MTTSIPPHALMRRYEKEIAPKVDAMKVDQLWRLSRKEAPCRAWFYYRAWLNGHKLRLLHVDDDLVVVRVK